MTTPFIRITLEGKGDPEDNNLDLKCKVEREIAEDEFGDPVYKTVSKFLVSTPDHPIPGDHPKLASELVKVILDESK